jgi:hypothetical protein
MATTTLDLTDLFNRHAVAPRWRAGFRDLLVCGKSPSPGLLTLLHGRYKPALDEVVKNIGRSH